ncbi:hypothetical protein PHLGIDRAFT_366607 [Phlebiopsis gigantea 11061_1 CR5-6]|uniref:Protein kinase domain-containing protein n=1 Tax=Phlebiopsis gigantea (strain 11061_1 CR5-6) TaxID=745531 RepID=A0A0C3PP70_PHLG1|nr:hypothetical protein PHLGIDRAFT_366607 [Phlebiopsis gigantea 11061_1 CR5-6]
MPRELISQEEACDVRGGRYRFIGLTICWREGGDVYRVEHPHRTFDLDALEAPDPIPPEHLHPKWRDDLLEAPTPPPDDVFVKTVRVEDYDPEYPDRLPDTLLKEISVLEQLRKTPHPNICVYRGCVREGDRIVGLALQRHPRNLYEHMQSGEFLDRRRIVADVKSGIEHLHSLGLVHGDLSPANVMIDAGRAILVDFGATLREGEQKVVAGTPGWFREGHVAVMENDFFSLGIMAQWLEHGKDLDPDDIPITSNLR